MPDTDILNQEQVAEIEARANDASPTYCVNWEKGDHALLQASGWRPAHEEQPRTIATFDRDEGYVDLLFCAEARTDIPALCRTLRAAWAENQRYAKVLSDRLRGIETLEASFDKLDAETTALRDQLARAQTEHNNLVIAYEQLESRLAQVEKERNDFEQAALALSAQLAEELKRQP